MYSETPINCPRQPEHIEIASKMANEISQRFSPTEQNEVVKAIYDMIKAERKSQIKEAEQRCQYLQDTLVQLG